MANKVSKTEHAGAKNGGGGYWGLRVDAKSMSNRARRKNDRHAADEDWGEDDPDSPPGFAVPFAGPSLGGGHVEAEDGADAIPDADEDQEGVGGADLKAAVPSHDVGRMVIPSASAPERTVGCTPLM